MPYGDNPPHGLPPYGTPPPFAGEFYVDGAKAVGLDEELERTRREIVEQLALMEEPPRSENLDVHRASLTTKDAEYVFDVEDMGDIVVSAAGRRITFSSPVKALKQTGGEGDLVIISQELTEDGMVEWPVATFRNWDYVYRVKHVKYAN